MRKVIWVAWLSGCLVVTEAPSICAAQNGPQAAQSGTADSQAMKPRTVLETGVKLHYKGDFEEADVYLQQAAQVRASLNPNEQAQLDDMLRRNADAVKGRKVALDLIQKTSAAMEAGRTKEAETYLKTLQVNRYLNPQDQQVVKALAQQVKGKPLAKAGQPNLQVKQDPDTLMMEARKACEKKDWDTAEQMANAAKAAGYSWTLPWSDNPDKVLREVSAARAKMGQAGTNANAAANTNNKGSRGLLGGNDQRKAQAVATLKQASDAAKAGDFVSARAMVKQVEDMKVSMSVFEEYTVDKVKNEISRGEAAAAKSGGNTGVVQAGMSNAAANQQAMPTGDARSMVKEARAALAAGEVDKAEMLAKAARNQHTDWGLFEDTADKVLGDVNKAKESRDHARATAMLTDARRLFDAGKYDEAEKLTYQAEALRKNYPVWYRGERPDRLRAEIVAKKKNTTKPNLPPLTDPKAQQADVAAASAKVSAPISQNVNGQQQQAQAMLAQARVHLNRGEYKVALDLAVAVKNMNVTLPASTDSPDQIIKAVETVMAANQMKADPAAGETVRAQARQCLAEARLAQKQNKLVEAMNCVNKARRLNAFYQPSDETPEKVAAELKQAAIAQVKTFTDAAETLARQDKLKESVTYYEYVQKLSITYNLDAAAITGRMSQLQAQMNAKTAAPTAVQQASAPAAPVSQPTVTQAAANVPAAPMMPLTPPAVQPPSTPVVSAPTMPAPVAQAPVEKKTDTPVAQAPVEKKVEAPVVQAPAPAAPVAQAPVQAPMAAPSMNVPTMPTMPAAAPTAPVVAQPTPAIEENKGQALLVQAQQALRAGQLTEAKKLAEALYTGPFQMKEQANLLLTQIDEAECQKRCERCLLAFEQLQRAISRKEFELALSLANEIDASKLPADKQQQFKQIMASKDMQPKTVAQATTPTDAAVKPAVAQADGTAPKAADGKGSMIDEVRARQEVELQRVREAKRQCELKANQLAGKGDLDGAIAELESALTQVQKADLDRDMQAKLEKQLGQRIRDFQVLAEKVAFNKAQKEKLGGDAGEKKMKIMLAKEHQREEVTKLMKDHANFMNDGKYVEAELCAMKAREIDPDNVQAEVAVFKARAMRNLTDETRIRENKNKAYNIAQNDVDRALVPLASDEQPVVINPKVMEQANKRGMLRNQLPQSPANKTVNDKMESMVSVNFQNKPLSYVLEELRTMSGANIVPQDEFLKSENISLDFPVDIKLNNVSLKTALNLVLSKARLTYMVRDGVILVTTQAGKQADKVTVTYQVNDLIVPRDDMANMASSNQMGPDGNPVALNWSKTSYNGDSVSSASMANGAVAGSPELPKSNRKVGQTLERQLIQLLTETIEPQTWNTMGGSGNITYYPHGMTLVVSQTPDIQEQIETLLARLRELQELQVTVEVRFITLTEDFFERVGVDMDLQIRTASNTFNRQVATGQFGPPGMLNTIGNVNTVVGLTPSGNFTQSLNVPVNNSSFLQSALPAGFAQFPGIPGANGGLDVGLAFLSNIQVFLFMEAVQGDARTNVLTAPKVTLFNGQTASISSTVQEFFVTSFQAQRDLFTGAIVFIPQTQVIPTGIVLTVQAVVTADRRYVQLSLAPSISRVREVRTFSPVIGLNLQQPIIEVLAVSTTVQVPDGGTILMGGLKDMSEQRREFGPPVISKIPYINRLFRNSMYGRESSSLLMMVTPRIIIPEEEEERLGSTFSF